MDELEADIREELTIVERAEPEDTDVRLEDLLFDPMDAQRYEVGLRNLLGAVETVEHAELLDRVRAVDRPIGEARYGRMFTGLTPLRGDPGQWTRVCATPAADDDARGAAGWPFFGQLIAHDITADRSPIAAAVGPDLLRNARSPRLNLQMLYADGPVGAPYLFDRDDPAMFLLDGYDVPRNRQGIGMIGDPRNDSHLFVLSLHVAMLRAHNRIVDLLRAGGASDVDVFDRARLSLTWHYQWVAVHDFLPRIVGAELVEQVLAEGGRWFAPPPNEAYLPLEFSHAAFRYGHGQIRPSYRLVAGGPDIQLFPDLVGFTPLTADRRLDLAQIFDLPGRPAAQRAKRIDGRLAESLLGLPEALTGANEIPAHRSLAVRDLVRGDTTDLPSGEAIARLVGATPLTADELGHGFPNGTPLWFYVLKEAEHRTDGEALGPVGGRIVAEVLIGLLRADPASYLSVAPEWTPTLPAAGPTFSLTDLLTLG
ncbi:MAG TPA: peroxidase family protein [Pseudonocardiaceae bacterium]